MSQRGRSVERFTYKKSLLERPSLLPTGWVGAVEVRPDRCLLVLPVTCCSGETPLKVAGSAL